MSQKYNSPPGENLPGENSNTRINSQQGLSYIVQDHRVNTRLILSEKNLLFIIVCLCVFVAVTLSIGIFSLSLSKEQENKDQDLQNQLQDLQNQLFLLKRNNKIFKTSFETRKISF